MDGRKTIRKWSGANQLKPVETLLDLHELRLTDQAERMIQRLTDAVGK